jgi:hypothetical protein
MFESKNLEMLNVTITNNKNVSETAVHVFLLRNVCITDCTTDRELSDMEACLV